VAATSRADFGSPLSGMSASMERILIEDSHGNAKARILVTTQKKERIADPLGQEECQSELASSVSLVLQGHRKTPAS